MGRTLDDAQGQQNRRDQIVIPELEAATSRRYRFWSHKEESVLQAYYDKVELNKLLEYWKEHFPPGRTRKAILEKAKLMGLVRRSKNEGEVEHALD